MAKTRVAPDPNVAANLGLLMKVFTDLGTQQELAKKSGVGQTTIGRILRSEVSPTGENLRRLADSFNVDVGYLYYRPEHFMERLKAGTLRKLPSDPRDSMVAHEVSYTAIEDAPITPWEVVVSLQRMPAIPPDLMVEVPDEALAQRGLMKGEKVWFKAANAAQPRNVVLIEANGRRYIRRFTESGRAEALDSAFDSFDPGQFKVVAVMHMRPQSSI